MCMNPCRVINARKTDPPEIAEQMSDFREARKMAKGKSFRALERRHLLALDRRVDEQAEELNQLRLENLKLRIHRS